MIPLEGEVKATALPESFGRLFQEQCTGKLRVAAGTGQSCVYFEDGSIVYATSSEGHLRLGAILIQDGLIGPNDRAMAMSMVLPGKRVGDILVQLGKIQPDDLQRARLKQAQAICAALFGVQGGSFVYNDGAKIPPDLRLQQLSTPNILMDGLRRMAVFDQMKTSLGSPTTLPRLAGPLAQICREVALTPTETRLLARIDGTASIKEIIRFSSSSEADTYKLLYALRLLGFLLCDTIPPFARPVAQDGKASTGPERAASDLDTAYARISDFDNYDVLGVPDNASTEEIKRAYSRLVKSYHPDRIGAAGSETRKKAERVFARITEAYQVLVDEDSRRRYDRAGPAEKKQFGSGGTRKSVTKAESEAVEKWAQTCYEKGMESFKARLYADAVQRLAQAVRSNPRKAEYSLALGWACARNPATAKEAERAFARAVNVDRFNPEPYVQMGKYYREAKDLEKAKALFQRALALDDQHEEALKELAEVEAGPAKKSIWNKVTGR